jgi:ribosomal protein L37AE/L43A
VADLFCPLCWLQRSHKEVEDNLWQCRECGSIRDMTDPDQSIGKAGEL